MEDADFWELRLGALQYVFVPHRASFLYDVETAGQWVWLALESGRFRFKVGRGRGALEGECGPGDWVLCPPGEPFARRMVAPIAFHYMRFECDAPQLYAFRGSGTLRDAGRWRSNLAALRTGQSQSPGSSLNRHLLRDILGHAHRERQFEARPVSTDPLMLAARARLEGCCEEAISMATLAGEFHLTPPEFSRRFRGATGQAPREFLLERRLDKARRLLLETDLTVDAVARNCGFANGFYFSRYWTKKHGVAPARFRRAHRL